MKPHLLKIHLYSEHSFNIKHDVVKHFYNKWHYHPELELVYILQGSGRQFIGDSIHHFKAGDMILLGANLPHLWHSDEKYFLKSSNLKSEAIVVHFMPDCLGDQFLRLPESKTLLKLFDKAQQGVRIKHTTKKIVGELLERLLVAKDIERISLLLQILNTISHSKQTKPVCSKGIQFDSNPKEAERLNKVYQFVLEHFAQEISLQQVSKLVHLSPQSFCRYFKSRIKKTFSQFLIEVRIGHACKLLAETEKSISHICYESGYNNFSNFNKHFKKVTRKTPSEHRDYYKLL